MLFYLGTQDLNPADYSHWHAPSGFTPTATVADWNTLFNGFGTSTMFSTCVKTPHGLIPPATSCTTPGGIVWSGALVISPGATVTFGFDCPRLPRHGVVQ